MTLVVDIGNTNIVCGIYESGRLHWHARYKTDRKRTCDEYFGFLVSFVGTKYGAWEVCNIDKICIASVVPELTRIWHHLCLKYFSAEVFTINGYTPLGMSYDVADPGFIGADLIVNAFAAWQKYNSACIIIDLGTATTIQLISATGRFIGTIIAPGIRTAATQLFEKAALLSEIELTPPHKLLGTNTSDALLSGIVTGHALMIDGFINKLKYTYPEQHPLTVVATGGIADLITPMVSSITVMDKALTLDGLNLAADLLAKVSGSYSPKPDCICDIQGN